MKKNAAIKSVKIHFKAVKLIAVSAAAAVADAINKAINQFRYKATQINDNLAKTANSQ